MLHCQTPRLGNVTLQCVCCLVRQFHHEHSAVVVIIGLVTVTCFVGNMRKSEFRQWIRSITTKLDGGFSLWCL